MKNVDEERVLRAFRVAARPTNFKILQILRKESKPMSFSEIKHRLQEEEKKEYSDGRL